jgi:hypothetical protein
MNSRGADGRSIGQNGAQRSAGQVFAHHGLGGVYQARAAQRLLALSVAIEGIKYALFIVFPFILREKWILRCRNTL